MADENLDEPTMQVSVAEFARLRAIATQYEDMRRPMRLIEEIPKAWIPPAQVPRFSGQDENLLVQEFLSQVRKFKESRFIPDKHFLASWMPTLLTGQAGTWFESRSLSFDSWDEFSDAMMRRFSNAATQDLLRGKILDRKLNPTENVSAYFKDLMDWNQRLLKPIPEDELCALAFRNLSYKLKAMLHGKHFGSVLEMSAEAEVMDSYMRAAVEENESVKPKAEPPKGYFKDPSNLTCHRCFEKGHVASSCPAPHPVAKNSGNWKDSRRGGRQ